MNNLQHIEFHCVNIGISLQFFKSPQKSLEVGFTDLCVLDVMYFNSCAALSDGIHSELWLN